MTEYQIVPHARPDEESDWLPCDEQHATRWAVVKENGSTLLFETREDAEDYIRQKSRARRFTWHEGDIEHG